MNLGFYGRTFGDEAQIPPKNFDLWEKRAVAALNRLLARDISQNPDENAKMCICEVAEFLFENSKRLGIESENTDGYSVKYSRSEADGKILEIAKNWLSGSDILYRGDVL